MRKILGPKVATVPDFPSDESFNRLFPDVPTSSRVSMMCRRDDYSASHIARAVEDADAHVLNLNVTSDEAPEGYISVELRIDHLNPASVARSLERYGYIVAGIEDIVDNSDDDSRRRIDELLRYLNV